ncbi:MAG: hypothetical protein ACREN0_00075, partial [Thermodesulfobacteriota bacterium]
MAEVRNYKIVGKYPNEGLTFKNGIRVQFKGFACTTSNPVEIATIENSDLFKTGKIKRTDKRETVKVGPDTAGQVTTQTPFSMDPGEKQAFDKEKEAFEAEKKAFMQMKADFENGSKAEEPPKETEEVLT